MFNLLHNTATETRKTVKTCTKRAFLHTLCLQITPEYLLHEVSIGTAAVLSLLQLLHVTPQYLCDLRIIHCREQWLYHMVR